MTAWIAPGAVAIEHARAPLAGGRSLRSFALPVAGHDGWHGSIEVLASGLGSLPARGATLAVVLSDHFVRHAALAWRTGLASAADWQAYATDVLARAYGEAVSGWRVRVASGLPGDGRIACAIDQALFDALVRTTAGAGHALDAVEPAFCRAWNRHRRTLAAHPGWLVTVEPGRVCIGRTQEDGAVSVARARTGASPEPVIAALLREARFAGATVANGAATVVWALARDPLDAAALAECELRMLPRPPGVPEPAWVLGMI